MGSNEIRLRRQKLSEGKIKTHRNYAMLMQRHKRDQMIKQAIRFLVYFMIIAFLLILSFIVVHRMKKQEMNNKSKTVTTEITKP